MTRPRPSAGFQILSLFAAYAVAGLFWGAFAASAPEFQMRAGLDAAGFGLALGAMPLAALPVMQGFGRVAQRLAGRAIPLAMGGFAVGLVLLGQARDGWSFLLALAVLGGASGAMDIALNLRTATLEETTGARLFNRAHAVFPFSMLLASAGTGALRDGGVAAASIFPLVAVVFALQALVEWVAARHQRPPPSHPGPPGAPRAGLGAVALLLGGVAALGAFQESAAQSWAAIHVEGPLGGAPWVAGLAAAAFTLGLGLGRLGAHALEHALRPLPTVRVAAMLGAAGFVALAVAGPVWAVVALFLVAGIGVGPVEPAVFRAVARRTEGPARGRTLATVTAIAYLGYLVSPPVLGLIAGAAGFGALWLTGAAAALAVVGLTLILSRRG